MFAGEEAGEIREEITEEIKDRAADNMMSEEQRLLEEERQRNFDIIEILASEYTSVYYIDLSNDGLVPYTMNEETETTFGSVFRSGITYSEAYKLYVDKLVYPEDKEMMLNAGSIENIKRQLANKKTFITTYRSADDEYSEMKFVKVGGEYDKPIAVALGFANKDEETRAELKEEESRQRDIEIIKVLASEYTSVYYIDLRTDDLNPYTMNDETETTFGSVFRSGITYSEAFRLYVDKFVYLEDKSKMLKAGSVGNIMKELRTKKTFITTYRNDEGHYSEMKFVKVGYEEGIPEAVALGFADKDAELRSKEEEERVLQRNIEIIEILASEYTSVYYIDLTTDELDPYTMNEQTESQFGKIFRSGIKYSDAFKMYVDTLVYPDDKAKMLTAGSIYNILKELSNKKTFITTYRNSEGHYSEMKFVKVGDSENPQSVALGFADKDDELRAELERKAIAARDAAVIEGLSDDFGCVVYASFEDDSPEIHYRFDSMFEKTIPGWSSITNFEERLNRLISTIMHPDDRQEFYEATRQNVVKQAINNDNAYFVNFRTLINGEVTYYQAKFVRDENSESHFIVGFHNVDEATKREMEALELAESASLAKTSFLFNMSHDIRTPMNAILGYSSMALRNIDDKEKVIECLNKTNIAGEALLNIINDVLEMSRIESGKFKIEETPGDAYLSFSHVEDLVCDLARAKDIELVFGFGEIKNRYVYCDQIRAERVFVNILSNAIKYTQKGGKVNVMCEEIESHKPGYATLKYTFTDNGIGMGEEFQKHAFEHFTREENSTVSKIQGTGLGLALCKSFVELMGGTIGCKSKKGEGSTFTVILPCKIIDNIDAVTNKENAYNDNILSFHGKRILLVEDNEMNREIASEILSEDGVIVTAAEDGTKAIELLRSVGPDAYDAILMDIQMPFMNGYEATRKIRKMYPESNIPIIALSANAFEEDRLKSIEAGMNEHIAKPIDIAILKRTLARFL